MTNQTTAVAAAIRTRFLLAAIGTGAGLALWYLAEILPDQTDNERLIVALIMLAGSFFAVVLAASGPLRPGPAALAAASTAALSTLLFTWAGFRFDSPTGLFETGPAVAAWVLLVAIPTPFLIAALRPRELWRDYPALFSHAWGITVRYVAAWAFTGTFWGVLMLSDQVLQIVGIDVIERLLDIEAVPFGLTGLVLGLGLAVVYELREMISPALVLRLLRLLLPLVFVVSLVFVIAVPFNGLGGLLQGISAAGTLMGMAVAAVTLVTVTIDRTGEDAAEAAVLTWSARLMSLLVALLGGLAVWAVYLRIDQYGLTPDRIAALTGAAVTLVYGLAYAGAVVLGADWQARIRRANVTLALGLVALAALWLTPILNAERMAVRSQMARLETGKIPPADVDLWTLGHDWGRVGSAALERLRAPDHPMAEALAPVLARLDAADNQYEYRHGDSQAGARQSYSALRAVLPIRPEGRELPDQLADETATASVDQTLQGVLAGCRRQTKAGAPACVGVIGQFHPGKGDEPLFIYWDGTRVQLRFLGGSDFYRRPIVSEPKSLLAGSGLIDQVLAGDYSLSPPWFDALHVGGISIWARTR